MATHFKKLYFMPVLLAILVAACGSPPEDGGPAANANAPQAASQNGTPVTASQGSAPPAQPLQVQPLPAQAAAKPAAPAALNGKTNASTAANASALPRLVVPTTKLNFGNQKKEKTLARTLQIKNEGKAELKIEAVEPSCGCTAVDFPKALAPGKSGTIKIKIDTGSSLGIHLKSMTIKSNDPANPSLRIDLEYFVK